MTKLLSVFLILISISTFAKVQTENFELKYEVFEGTGVCWQTCRDSRCEEADYEIFWDTKTFVKLANAGDEGMSFRIEADKDCYEETINHTGEHMPALKKEDPKAAQKILKEKGTKVKIMIYNNVRKEVNIFIDSVLN